jgi:Cu(I)/Ag(I) efflux system membrane fusion protein
MDLVPVKEKQTTIPHPRQLTISKRAKELAEIQTVPAVRKKVQKTIKMFGKISYDETRISYITAWIPGRIDRLYFDFTGIKVKKGSPMVYIYSPDLLSAQKEYLQAIKIKTEFEMSPNQELKAMTAATLKSAEEKLRLLGLTPKQIAQIKKQNKPKDHITIHAPISGTVIEKNAFEGMYVKTGTPIYTIADLSWVWVILEAYESDLIWIHLGQKVNFKTQAWPQKTFQGKVSFIDPFLNERKRTVAIRLKVPNPKGLLKPGMFVQAELKVQLPGKNKQLPLVIPSSAPLITGRRAIVYVQVPNTPLPTYEGRIIELGPKVGDLYIVKSGLKEGEEVVVEGNFKIDSALQIQAKPSLMSLKKIEKINIYECSCTLKRWEQPANEKKRCPYCGEAMPDCGRLIETKSSP